VREDFIDGEDGGAEGFYRWRGWDKGEAQNKAWGRGRIAEHGQSGDAGAWRNGDGPIVRARSRSPAYDVTNVLCFFNQSEDGGVHQLVTARRKEVLYICQGREAAGTI
jgi:hypothetical protein